MKRQKQQKKQFPKRSYRHLRPLTAILAVSFLFCAGLQGCAFADHKETEEQVEEQVEEQTEERTEEQTEGLSFETQTYLDERVKVDYIQAKGPDEAALEELNQKLKDFYLWQWIYGLEEEVAADTNEYYGTAAYAFVGGRLLSVQSCLSVTPKDGAYSSTQFSAQTFDTVTGEEAGALNKSPFTEETAEKFHLSEPGGDVPDELKEKAEQAFRDYVLGTDEIYTYFLTENGVGIYLANDVHAEGDYFIFEADGKELADILAEPFKEAFGL